MDVAGELGAHLSFGFAALGPLRTAVGAQSKWRRGPGSLRLSPSADLPPSLSCARSCSVLPAFHYPGVTVGGQGSLGPLRVQAGWGKGQGAAALDAGHCGSSSWRAAWLCSLKRLKKDHTLGLRMLMNPWTVVVSTMSGPRRPCHAPGPGHLIGMHMEHGSSWQMLWGCCLPEPGQTPRRRNYESQGSCCFLLPYVQGGLPNPGIEPTSLNISCIGRWALYHSHHLGRPPEPVLHNKRAMGQEAHASRLESSLHSPELEKAHAQH